MVMAQLEERKRKRYYKIETENELAYYETFMNKRERERERERKKNQRSKVEHTSTDINSGNGAKSLLLFQKFKFEKKTT